MAKHKYILDCENGVCVLQVTVKDITEDDVDRILTAVRTAPKAETSVDRKLLDFLEDNSKLAAVKYYKEVTGIGLKDAKEYVDNFARINGYDGTKI